MELAQPFTGTEVESMIKHAVEKFFTTMVSEGCKLDEVIDVPPISASGAPPPQPLIENTSMVASAVGYIGTVSGVIYLYINEHLAKEITCKFLGMEMREVEADGHETVNDALGEISNMVVGTFKNAMCDKGYNCRLTIPSILRGNSFVIEHNSEVTRRIYRFKVFDSIFAVDILMKNGE